jgi:hypothetical protein
MTTAMIALVVGPLATLLVVGGFRACHEHRPYRLVEPTPRLDSLGAPVEQCRCKRCRPIGDHHWKKGIRT